MAAELNVANTILAQLGGNRFIAMTGAKYLTADFNRLFFGLPTGAKKGINKVEITLMGNDMYEVNFYRIAKRGLDVKLIMTYTNVYADQLRDVFTTETGLDTSL